MRKTKLMNRKGRIIALDTQFTGEEPEWDDVQELDKDAFGTRLNLALKFYNYYCDKSFYRAQTAAWMKANGYSAEQISRVKTGPQSTWLSTCGKLSRMVELGLSDKKKICQSTIGEIIKDGVDKTLASMPVEVEDPATPQKKKVKVSVYDRLLTRVNEEVITELDKLLDSITEIEHATSVGKIPNLDIGKLLRVTNTPRNGVKCVIEWLTRYTEEFSAAADKTCGDAVEGYSWMKPSQLKRVIRNFEKMKDECKAYAKIKTATRKPRKKASKAVGKQVVRLKYATDSKEFGLTSINPEKIPYSQRVYFFNTKYRILSVYFASGSEGFTVAGTSLKQFDEEKSFSVKLRAGAGVEKILPIVLGGTPKKIDTALKKVNSKPGSVTGRINDKTIILRVLNQK